MKSAFTSLILGIVIGLSVFLGGCTSIITLGQTREQMEESGATRWSLYEYDYDGSHYVWVPHWNEGLLHVSTPTASNGKALDILRFTDDHLIEVIRVGTDRERWAMILASHGRIAPVKEMGLASGLYMAVTAKLYHVGDPIECVLFANGFPRIDADSNPHCLRAANDLKRDDVLHYFTSKGGAGMDIVIRDGKIAEIREGKYLARIWRNYLTDIKP
jgi:hypothetical protein